MSVLIKGMKMPKNCDSCRIMVLEDTNCVPELFCGCPIVFKAHPQGVGHRPDYCPLAEVHTPHGDLIDREALIKALHAWFDDDEVHAFEKDAYWHHGVVMKIINDALTIIESEEA